MEGRGLVAGALVLLATTASCAPQADGDESDEGDVSSEPEVPLALTVDHVDVAHGSMRLRATMVDGSPDVSIVLGGTCDGSREVGRGFATRVSFVWALDAKDVADALRCDLVVRARAWSDRGRVIETAALSLVPDVMLVTTMGPGGEIIAPDEGTARPELEGMTRDPTQIGLAFRSLTASATLAVADLRVERTPTEQGTQESESTGAFAVPYDAFAQALLEDRPLRIDGTAFRASLTIVDTVLERDSPAEAEGTGEVETGEVETANEIEVASDVETANEIEVSGSEEVETAESQ